MKKLLVGPGLLVLVFSVHADLVQLNTGKTFSGRVADYANGSFSVLPARGAPVSIPANTVTTIDFTKGAVLATVEATGQKPVAGKIWLIARGALNFDADTGETTRIPLSNISRVTFSDQPLPERPAPPPRPKPVRPPPEELPANEGPAEVISHGKAVDIEKHCVSGKITIVDFYADWCGPCRAVGPKLEERVKKDPDLVLLKVDIVKWGTPVCKQFAIGGIPYIQVYDRRGNKVGDMTGFNDNLLESFLNRAR